MQNPIQRMTNRIGMFTRSPYFIPSLIGLGILLRLIAYVYNRSLWLDEAALAVNLIFKDFPELTGRLEYLQTTPLGFLFAVKSVTILWGNHEYALRLIPFLSGIASCFFIWKLSERFVSQRAVVFAVALFAITQPLIYFATELKQYSTEVLFAVLLLMGAADIIKTAYSRKSIFCTSCIAVAAVWFSFSSVFILAGITITLAADILINKKERKHLAVVMLFTFLWGSVLIFYYSKFLTGPASLQTKEAYWLPYYMPFPPKSVEDFTWFLKKATSVFQYPLGLTFTGLGAAMFIFGCVSLKRTDKILLLQLLAPIALTLIASGLKKYPFGGRVILFLAPIFILLVAEGMAASYTFMNEKKRIFVHCLIVLIFIHPVISAIKYSIHPRTVQEMRPVVQNLMEEKKPSDVLYVYKSAGKAFRYYAHLLGFKDPYIIGKASRDDLPLYKEEMDQLLKHKRFWLLFSHTKTPDGTDEEYVFSSYLHKHAENIRAFWRTGGHLLMDDTEQKVSLYLFEPYGKEQP